METIQQVLSEICIAFFMLMYARALSYNYVEERISAICRIRIHPKLGRILVSSYTRNASVFHESRIHYINIQGLVAWLCMGIIIVVNIMCKVMKIACANSAFFYAVCVIFSINFAILLLDLIVGISLFKIKGSRRFLGDKGGVCKCCLVAPKINKNILVTLGFDNSCILMSQKSRSDLKLITNNGSIYKFIFKLISTELPLMGLDSQDNALINTTVWEISNSDNLEFHFLSITSKYDIVQKVETISSLAHAMPEGNR